ncbi:hypothetical protein [Okeania sp. KiyG1]|uniref:hypothetical protein n=1 Tax=Okeania sp. KiyG1 TaxID=2720165 RepID=UPI0019234340|nr:hypothetical protein [Okeania sp. KiyG1]GGA53281.1 hypothetical protein CYANOKiyG1_73350 [Okeania sp. KiyG1]
MNIPDLDAGIAFESQLGTDDEVETEYGLTLGWENYGLTITNQKVEFEFNLLGIGLLLSTEDGGTAGFDLGLFGVELNKYGEGSMSYLFDLYKIEVTREGCYYVKQYFISGVYVYTEIQEIPGCKAEEEKGDKDYEPLIIPEDLPEEVPEVPDNNPPRLEGPPGDYVYLVAAGVGFHASKDKSVSNPYLVREAYSQNSVSVSGSMENMTIVGRHKSKTIMGDGSYLPDGTFDRTSSYRSPYNFTPEASPPELNEDIIGLVFTASISMPQLHFVKGYRWAINEAIARSYELFNNYIIRATETTVTVGKIIFLKEHVADLGNSSGGGSQSVIPHLRIILRKI